VDHQRGPDRVRLRSLLSGPVAARREGRGETHPEVFNAVLFALLLVLPLVEARWSWPRYLKKVASGVHGARTHHFGKLIFWEWAITLAFLACWMWSGRSWASLMVNHVSPIQSAMFLVYAGLMVLVLWRQRGHSCAAGRRRTAAQTARLRQAAAAAHGAERRLFWAVSATAGICEETLYRGFLTWYIADGREPGMHLGPAPPPGLDAIVLSSLIFGLGHFYLG